MDYRSEWDRATAAEQYHRAQGFVPDFEWNDSKTRGKKSPFTSQGLVTTIPQSQPVKDYIEGSYHAATIIFDSSFDKVLDLPTVVGSQHIKPQFGFENNTLYRTITQQLNLSIGRVRSAHSKDYLSKNLERYLLEVAQVPEFSDGTVVRNAKWLLGLLGKTSNVDVIPTPQAAPSEENSLAFSWQTDDNQLGLYIYPTGKFDWLWRNRSTKEYEGEEDIDLSHLPERLVLRFRNTLADR